MSNESLKSDFRDFIRCAEEAPAGTYEDARELRDLIGETCYEFMREVRALDLQADNCDLIFEVECAIYNYVRRSNPDSPRFILAESFGRAMEGPAHARVKAQTISNRDFLRSIGIT